MAWHDLIEELEKKLEGTLRGVYRPLDNIPFFRVQYPPVEEKEAIKQFHLLADRLCQRGWKAECVSLTELFQEALASLINCSMSELSENLRNLERNRDRSELQAKVSDFLPDELTKIIVQRFKEWPREGAIFLLRMGSLYPFVRTSSLLSKLEGKLRCAIILPYPGTTLGALLDAPPADPHGGYYRGEVITWK